MVFFKFLTAIFFMSSLMLSCADSDREDCPHHRDKKERDKKDKASGRKGVHHRNEKVQTQPAPSNEEINEDPVKEDLEKEDLLVERPLDSDNEKEEGAVVADEEEAAKAESEELPALEEDVAKSEEEFIGSEEEPDISSDKDSGEEVESSEPEEVEWEGAFISEGEIFSITHVGKEGDRFVMKYKSQELVLDEPLACVLLTGVHFNELRIEDGTDFLPVICGANSTCEPGNYNLVNDSWPGNVWDDYDMEPSEYNDDFDCQEFPLLEE